MKVQYHMRSWSGFPAHSLRRVFYCILWLGLNCCTMFVIFGFNLSTCIFLNFLWLCSAHCSAQVLRFTECAICTYYVPPILSPLYSCVLLHSMALIKVLHCSAAYCSLKVSATFLHYCIVEPLLLTLLDPLAPFVPAD